MGRYVGRLIAARVAGGLQVRALQMMWSRERGMVRNLVFD
jgi:hypothetical protein